MHSNVPNVCLIAPQQKTFRYFCIHTWVAVGQQLACTTSLNRLGAWCELKPHHRDQTNHSHPSIDKWVSPALSNVKDSASTSCRTDNYITQKFCCMNFDRICNRYCSTMQIQLKIKRQSAEVVIAFWTIRCNNASTLWWTISTQKVCTLIEN